MSKKKKKFPDAPEMVTGPNTNKMRRRWAAEDGARVALDADPKERDRRQKKLDDIAGAIFKKLS